jgi:hypothetical protein
VTPERDDPAIRPYRPEGGARALYEGEGFVPVAFGTSPAPESISDVRYRRTPPARGNEADG